MENTLWNWLFQLPQQFAQMGSWLTTSLPYIGMSPLALLGVGGLTAVIVFSLIRLVVGG